MSGVAGVLADPTLELHDSTGAVIASNDNWQDNSAEDQMVLTDNNLAPTDEPRIRDRYGRSIPAPTP